MSCWLSCTAHQAHASEWNKYDDRLMKAAERGEVEKVSSILAKKGVNPSKLDVEGRSAFHVVASKGNLDCLNAILVNGVDIAAKDASGRNALHLAAKYGHALCVQKLLQYNCPTEHGDHQNRTALHDAAMTDCTSSIQLLCDHGASVNAKDADGRTPLVLATQMCRPNICQLLIDRGADINARDKQNRTALMLGCEHGCAEAVDVLIKNGADINLLDSRGHDSSYYARMGDNLDTLTLVKTAVTNFKGRLSLKKGLGTQQASYMSPKRNLVHMPDDANMKSNQREQQNVQDLEAENGDLKEKLRQIQHEQMILLDKVNELQLQLNEEFMVADDLEREKEKLKSLLTAKEKQLEESLKNTEALKNLLKYYECTSAGVSLSVHQQSRSMLRPLELSSSGQSSPGETELLKKELETLKASYDAIKQEKTKVGNELAHKVAECKALALECERVREDSDEQIKQLEDALKDVQKRMFDSEGKVKQMQTHFLALKEHLAHETSVGTSRLTDDLKEQLKDMKAKYEGASLEVGKLRNQIRQNEMLVEEFKRDEGRLVEENKRLQRELSASEIDRERSGRKVVEMEGQLKAVAAKLSLSVPAEKFENMKSLLSGEANEKAKKYAEVEREYEKAQVKVRQLERELENSKAKLAQHVAPEDHELLKNRLEQKSGELEKKVTELNLKIQALHEEGGKAREENRLLSHQVQSLKGEIKSHYVPIKLNEEMRKSQDLTIAELNRKLLDVTRKYEEKQVETETLRLEKSSLTKNVSHLEAAYIPPEKHQEEVTALKSTIAELRGQISEVTQKRDAEQAQVLALRSENTRLNSIMNDQYVPLAKHEGVKAELSHTLDKTNRELSGVKKNLEGMKQDFFLVKDENGVLKTALENSRNQMQTEFIPIKEHQDKMALVSKSMKEVQENNTELQAKFIRGQEEIVTLHGEIEAQRKELDTIQECIKLKYAPIVSFEEREQSFKVTVKELKDQLLEQTQKCSTREEEARKCQEENEKLKHEVLAIQNDLKDKHILVEKSIDMEKAFSRKTEELNRQLKDLSEKYTEVKLEKERLLEENAKQASEVLAVQTGRYVPREQVEALKKSLGASIEDLKGELERKRMSHEQEKKAVGELQRELENQKKSSVSLAEHLQMKETWEREVGILKASVKEKEDENRVTNEEVSKLKVEIANSKQVLKELKTREVVDLSEYKAMKSSLETQVSSVTENLTNLSKKYKEMCEESSHAQKDDLSARDEKEAQSRSFNIEQKIQDQKERCDKSLTTMTDLQRRIQASAKQIEAKDSKITELLKDIERLKQTVNGLSQPTNAGENPTKKQNQQIEALQHQVKSLKQQLADTDRQHQEVIATYRTHLLSAAQGHMDEDVQAALMQIIRMRQELIC
ncbi:uveal autoantigen with coiled-coil domains and ankyrin repeats isoform X2 [Ornithorhynchus anatinus]|uniref:Uveal autoantigen with coiled-coil domains and ankyrin repeats n=1 Tax=Ornithorhynchus anatinus TaxID=9258 RepID=A0A6I8P9M4_ORNAN|nr:uveal autoantigen with coiled-coil domains and ankyrin repeats isoform X2 [Ornithorhynchus anatinus]